MGCKVGGDSGLERNGRLSVEITLAVRKGTLVKRQMGRPLPGSGGHQLPGGGGLGFATHPVDDAHQAWIN